MERETQDIRNAVPKDLQKQIDDLGAGGEGTWRETGHTEMPDLVRGPDRKLVQFDVRGR